MALPTWASDGGDNGHGCPLINVDAGAAYDALLAEYRELYAGTPPAEFLKKDGELRAEWAEALDELAADPPSAYWAEVAYQAIKMDVQAAARSLNIEIRMHDAEKKYRQADLPEGRDVQLAAGGLKGGREAREHYKRLRGYVPGAG